MNPPPSTPKVRHAYQNAGTPPMTPIRLHPGLQDPIQTLNLASPRTNDYPESPHSPRKHYSSLHASSPKPPPFSLTQPGKKATWRPPRLFKTSRRSLGCLLVLLLVGALYRTFAIRGGQGGLRVGHLRWARWFDAGDWAEDNGLCRFVSPVEAYHRDLRRIRELYPPKEAHELNLTNAVKGQRPHSHHLYSSTGHLIVSQDEGAPHPIPVLLALGEKRWEETLARQSQSLGEAVREYTRRYGRLPPRGFDVWWEFAQVHQLVLPDEYDRINLDLAPFFALPKDEFKRRMRMVEDMPETFTLVVQDGHVDIEIKDEGGLKWDGTIFRANDASKLLQAFARYLPDLRATFSIFDQPQIYLSWARRGSLVDLGLRNELTTHLHETDDAKVRLSRSCAPESNYRRNASFDEGKSLIYDSLEAGDFCQNPYLIPLHGLTLETHDRDSHPRPHTQLLPLFSLAKTSINSDILITPLDQFNDNRGQDPKWELKRSSKLAWRGSPTGISMMTRDVPWRNAHRIRLHHWANNQSTEFVEFSVPDFGQDSENEDPEYEDEEEASHPRDHRMGHSEFPVRSEIMPTNEAMEYFFDIKLAGEPLQCSDADGTCQDMRDEITWAGHQSPADLNQNKFLLDIDGNGWSGRFRRLMSTNSVVIKTGIFTEWFQPHLIPWFMYIPAKLDFSDLLDIMAFFRGTPKHPELAFDETAKALARNGQCFVQRMFRLEDLQAYMMRLFLEYARLAADEDVDMDFHYDPTDQERELDLQEIRDDMIEEHLEEEALEAQQAEGQQVEVEFALPTEPDGGYEAGDELSDAGEDELETSSRWEEDPDRARENWIDGELYETFDGQQPFDFGS